MPKPKPAPKKATTRNIVPKEQRSNGVKAKTVRVTQRTSDTLADPIGNLVEWDDEELLRGQRRDKNGRFTGSPPKIVPTIVHEELVKRRLAFAKHQMAHDLKKSLEALGSIVESKTADPHARIKAAGMIMDRVLGKPKETLEVQGEEPKWMQTLNVAIISDPDALNDVPAFPGDAIDATSTVSKPKAKKTAAKPRAKKAGA